MIKLILSNFLLLVVAHTCAATSKSDTTNLTTLYQTLDSINKLSKLDLNFDVNFVIGDTLNSNIAQGKLRVKYNANYKLYTYVPVGIWVFNYSNGKIFAQGEFASNITFLRDTSEVIDDGNKVKIKVIKYLLFVKRIGIWRYYTENGKPCKYELHDSSLTHWINFDLQRISNEIRMSSGFQN
jgi:hypothetical protein